MSGIETELRERASGEEGHAPVALMSIVGAVGAVLVGVGVAVDSDALAIIAGVVLGVGVLAGSVIRHVTIDYSIFRRLEELEK